jgi:tRNA-dihydrouridine synthase
VRLVERILAAVRGRVPVTAKLRLGWDDDHLTGPRLAQMLESVGIAAIAIHGRTTEMKFRGQVRLEGIGRVVEAVRDIPVLGNGDIESPQDAEHMMRTTGCDGVMLARAATRQPWLLSRIHQLLEHGEDPGELDHHGMLRVIRRHVELCREHCEERRSLHVLRSRISRYARSLGHVKPLKEAFRLAEHTDEMLVAINEWLERPAPRRRDQQSQSLACPSQP